MRAFIIAALRAPLDVATFIADRATGAFSSCNSTWPTNRLSFVETGYVSKRRDRLNTAH